ncbi:MAG: hypothetical protein MI799_16960, partial [Desulfobacterales bacterium]|nr:hypothetical protein [Desulfobacterales bacterium]
MTNINNIQNIIQALDNKTPKAPQGSGQGFEAALNSAQEKIQASEEETGINELGEISAMGFD